MHWRRLRTAGLLNKLNTNYTEFLCCDFVITRSLHLVIIQSYNRISCFAFLEQCDLSAAGDFWYFFQCIFLSGWANIRCILCEVLASSYQVSCQAYCSLEHYVIVCLCVLMRSLSLGSPSAKHMDSLALGGQPPENLISTGGMVLFLCKTRPLIPS